MSPRVLVIARSGAALDAYRELIRPLSARFDIVDNLTAARGALVQTAYHALLVDVVTMVKAPHDEKAKMQEILSHFPVVRLKYEAERGKVAATLVDGDGGEEIDLAEFIDRRCPGFTPRRVRQCERAPYHLNVVASPDPLFGPDKAQRTNTLNISENGCFLYTVRDWPLDTGLWLQIPDLVDETPIEASVVRRVPWGSPGVLPGIGVKFAQISSSQIAEIRVLLRSRIG